MYDDTTKGLQNFFVTPKNEIYFRHMLATAYQNICESIDEFINQISSSFIKQKLLENKTLTFLEAYEKARSLELAILNCEAYTKRETTSGNVCAVKDDLPSELCSSLSRHQQD